MQCLKFSLFISIVFCCLVSEPALAAPGGKIASKFFDGFWGKMLFIGLFILFLPLITMNWLKQNRAIKRTRRDLVLLSNYSDAFNIFNLTERVFETYRRVHTCWSDQNLEGARNYMTEWLLRNQQEQYLNKWKMNGLVNICTIRKITSVEPYGVIHSADLNDHEGTKLIIRIVAKMQDYLKDEKTGEIIEGSEEYKKVSKIWTFTLTEGHWLLSNIEECDTLMSYIKNLNYLPTIESLEKRQENGKG